MIPSDEQFNFQQFKEGYIYQKMANRQMLLAILKKAPRETLIECLKDLKIIKRDWSKDKKTFVEKETSI